MGKRKERRKYIGKETKGRIVKRKDRHNVSGKRKAMKVKEGEKSGRNGRLGKEKDER